MAKDLTDLILEQSGEAVRGRIIDLVVEHHRAEGKSDAELEAVRVRLERPLFTLTDDDRAATWTDSHGREWTYEEYVTGMRTRVEENGARHKQSVYDASWLGNIHRQQTKERQLKAARVEEEQAKPEGAAALLDDLATFIRSYVVVSETKASAIALWILHTHAFEAAHTSPYLALISAEKRSGKTRLLRVLELLCARPWRVVGPSEAVVYRKIQRDKPTLLLDETDAIFARGQEYEALRALLNAGNEPGVFVPRVAGANKDKLEDFAVYCPKALAGIGELPDTVSDRAIIVWLKRKAPSETVERFRLVKVEEAAAPLRERAERWGSGNLERLAEAYPDIPDKLDDRAADGWEPLFAIADAAGGDWPARAREIALELSAPERRNGSHGIRLLQDIRGAFGEADRIATKDMVEKLVADEEAPWGNWKRGLPLTAHGLARLLRRYNIRPRTIKLEGGKTAKGYLREQFQDVWPRYLPYESLEPQSDT